MEDQRSRLEWPAARICDLLLGPPTGRARLVDHLAEALRIAYSGADCTAGGGCRAGGSADFGYTSLGLGVGWCLWAIFSDSIYVHDNGAARKPHQRYDC
jgi:hypothetical protein